MNLDLVHVLPDKRGFCPVLKPGECCRDALEGLWHFRNPDGAIFAACDAGCVHLGLKVGNPARVYDRPDGPIIKPPVRFAFLGDGVVDNGWTVLAGKWVKFNGC